MYDAFIGSFAPLYETSVFNIEEYYEEPFTPSAEASSEKYSTTSYPSNTGLTADEVAYEFISG